MKRIRKFSLCFIVSMVLYTTVEFFFDDAMLYFTGGILASFKEVLKLIGIKKHLVNPFFSWIIIVMFLSFMSIKVSNKFILFFTYLMLWVLMSWIDLIIYDIIHDDIQNTLFLNNHLFISSLIKSFILSLIYFMGDTISKNT